jgi:hypothetical protein
MAHTQVLVIGGVFFIILLWGVPALHRRILPISMRNDAVARAATVAGVLVIAAAAATIGLRGTGNAIARSDSPAVAVNELQRTVNMLSLPSPQWDLY